MKKKQPIIYTFIDSQNLNLGVRSMGWKLDFKKFRLYLKNKYHVQKAFLFIGHVVGNEALYEKLKTYGYLLVFKPTLEIYKNNKEKIKGNVDAELVLHTMIEKEHFNKAIIVSGDGDFHCLIEYLLYKKKLEKVMVPTKHYSGLLRKFNRNNFILRIDLLRSSLEHKKKTGIRGRSKP
ncbi:MAG: NYN domain-containing protein [bacterium]|nr:NYN domain-containing protein [bacterium]